MLSGMPSACGTFGPNSSSASAALPTENISRVSTRASAATPAAELAAMPRSTVLNAQTPSTSPSSSQVLWPQKTAVQPGRIGLHPDHQDRRRRRDAVGVPIQTRPLLFLGQLPQLGQKLLLGFLVVDGHYADIVDPAGFGRRPRRRRHQGDHLGGGLLFELL